MTPEQEAHNRHIETKHYEYGYCDVCRKLLLEAKTNHREHAGFPSVLLNGANLAGGGPYVVEGDWATVPHSSNECVTAYIEYGRKMGAS